MEHQLIWNIIELAVLNLLFDDIYFYDQNSFFFFILHIYYGGKDLK